VQSKPTKTGEAWQAGCNPAELSRYDGANRPPFL